MTDEDMRGVIKTIGEFVLEQIKPLTEEIATLRARVAAVEESGVRYCGVYQRAAQYKRGDVVTFDGSMWCAIVDVSPGQSPNKSPDWVLAVKKGRDAIAA